MHDAPFVIWVSSDSHVFGSSTGLAGSSLVFGSSAVFTGRSEGRQRVASSKAFRELIYVYTCKFKDVSMLFQAMCKLPSHILSWQSLCRGQAVHIRHRVSNNPQKGAEQQIYLMPLRIVPSYEPGLGVNTRQLAADKSYVHQLSTQPRIASRF